MKKLILSIAVVGMLFTSCGDDKAKKGSDIKADKKIEQKAPEKEIVIPGKIALSLSSSDQMKYDKKELRVKEGQEVTLTFTHTGKMPKTAMGHNFVLLQKGTNLAAFGSEAISAAATDYIPKSDAVLAHTKLIGGGESDTITFTAPAKGIYNFICSFPGHYAIMKGKFIVE